MVQHVLYCGLHHHVGLYVQLAVDQLWYHYKLHPGAQDSDSQASLPVTKHDSVYF